MESSVATACTSDMTREEMLSNVDLIAKKIDEGDTPGLTFFSERYQGGMLKTLAQLGTCEIHLRAKANK